MLFLRRKKMAVFLFDRGSRNKDQQQQEEEKKKKAESRHHRHDDGLYGSVVSSSSSSSKSGNSHSKGPSSIECDSSPNVTSPSSDCSARNEADGAGGGGWYGDGFEGGGGGGAAYEAGSYQLGSYRHYGGGSGVFPSPAPRRSLSPIGSSEWALRECELHTTWLNEVRKRCGQPAITDLRTAVADGVTVVQLTKALTSHEVCPVEQDQRLTKAQAQVNLDRCLAQLAAGGVDVIGVQANDLAEGDLKASLLLLGQIRRRYDTESAVRRSPAPSRGRAADSQHAHRAPFTETVSVHPQPAPRRLSPDMPGRLDVSQSHTPHRPDVSPRTRRARTTDDDRYLPGVSAGSEDLGAMANHMRQHSADHLDRRPPAYNHHHQHFNANIASTHHPAHATSAKPSPAPRPHSSMGVTSAERPPSQLGVAWSADSASKTRQPVDATVLSGPNTVSVEDRLRQLVLDNQRTARPAQYDDGELLLPPPPSREFGDGVTLGGVSVSHAYTDGATRPFGQMGVDPSSPSRDQGYVPSKPSERRSGPRGESLMHQPQPQSANFSFLPESQSPTFSESQKSTTSTQKANDMRSAWNKLYGPINVDWRPPSRHDVTSARHDSHAHEEIMLQQPPRGHTPLHGHPADFITHRRPSQSSAVFPGDHAQSPGPALYPLHPRESPMGQSSSTQGQTSDSSYRSSHSEQHAAVTTFKPPTGRGGAVSGTSQEEGTKVGGAEDEEEDLDRELRMLGPASKYPLSGSTDSRPASARLTPQTGTKFGLKDMFPSGRNSAALSRTGDARNSPQLRNSPAPLNTSGTRDVTARSSSKPAMPGRAGVETRNPMGGARINPAFAPDTEEEDNVQGGRGQLVRHQSHHALDAADAIFDYTAMNKTRRQLFSESSSRSVTPPLPPLSPSSSQPGSAPSTPSGAGGGGVVGAESRQRVSDSAPRNNAANGLFSSRPRSAQGQPAPQAVPRQRSSSAMGVPAARTPDLVTSAMPGPLDKRAGGGDIGRLAGGARSSVSHAGSSPNTLGVPAERPSKTQANKVAPHAYNKHDRNTRAPASKTYFGARSRSLDDLRESGNESNEGEDNDLSFDVENTLLTIAPSDVSEIGGGEGGGTHHHHHHHLASSSSPVPKDTRAIREQLGRLETMYHDVIKHVGADKHHGKGGGATRRWSIASSDTSSLRKGGKQVRGGHGGSTRSSKDLRSIQRRFQRLESHVVTLARSLAHLSSELRAHNTLRRDLEAVRREVRDIKQQGPAAGTTPDNPAFLVPPFEKFRGWIPSLTNPKRINKLTQFFGQEPPLLDIFLKKLGYERFSKNFAQEHIGMIELPYMTEERLETIGIPMGPRLRILQESQLCFRQENFNIYIV